MPDAGPQSLPQLALGLRVAVQVDPRWIETAAQRERQLATGGDVAPKPLGGEQPIDGGARERLGGEQHVAVRVPGSQSLQECSRTQTQVVLHDDVDRRPELAREFDRITSPKLEGPALVDGAADRIHV